MKQPINPAFLVSEEIEEFLDRNAIYQISYFDIAQGKDPWEIEFHFFKTIQQQLVQIENGLRTSNPNEDITVLITANKIYWILHRTLTAYLEMIQEPLGALQVSGPFPAWKMTSAEIAGGHVYNLRHLLLAIAHDYALLLVLQRPLGSNMSLMQREFSIGEKYVHQMLAYIKDCGQNITLAMRENFILMERCRVTFEAIQRGEVPEEQLGYALSDLEKVKDILHKRCQRELPPYLSNWEAIHYQMGELMREGENTHLTRMSRWELAFALMDEVPDGFRGQAELVTFEREKMRYTVAFRERELGDTVAGQQALAMNDKAVQTKEGQEPMAEPEPEPVEVGVEEESDKKKKVMRMAFSSRRGR